MRPAAAQVFVWVGSQSNEQEKKSAMQTAQE
jgi:Gelsolin repeat